MMSTPSQPFDHGILSTLSGRPQLVALEKLAEELHRLLEVANASSAALTALVSSNTALANTNCAQLSSLELLAETLKQQSFHFSRIGEMQTATGASLSLAFRESLNSELKSLSYAFAEYVGLLRTDVRNQTDQLTSKMQLLEMQLKELKESIELQLQLQLKPEPESSDVETTEWPPQKWFENAPEAEFLSPALHSASSLNVFPRDYNLSGFPDGKVVIFGLQKAGNTWLLSLLSDALGLPAFFNLHDPGQIGKRGVVSTHDPISKYICNRRDLVHGVCLIRDLRDIVASYFHYMQTESFQRDVPKAKYSDLESYYYDWFLSRMVTAHRYHTFWEEYASAGVPVLRYERLVSDTEGELLRLFERWGEPVESSSLKSAIASNDFETLRLKGRKIGDTMIDKSHFRRGRIGSYKDELPQSIIDDINSRFGSVMRRWGYSVP